jgi:hypothetical protein
VGGGLPTMGGWRGAPPPPHTHQNPKSRTPSTNSAGDEEDDPERRKIKRSNDVWRSFEKNKKITIQRLEIIN